MRHLALRLAHVTVPAVRVVVGELPAHRLPTAAEIERHDADWDASAALDSLDALIRGLADARFALLRLLESAPDSVWLRPLPPQLAPGRRPTAEPVGLGWLVACSYQHELAHLSSIWKLALYWDRIPPTGEIAATLPLQQPGRWEE